MNRDVERRCLQIVLAVLCLSPLGVGALGMIGGAAAFGGQAQPGVDSHFRYLSGIFFGIGVLVASCVPRIERQRERLGWVVLFVVIGGLARLLGFITAGVPRGAFFYAAFLELGVTPLVWMWQRRVARRYA